MFKASASNRLNCADLVSPGLRSLSRRLTSSGVRLTATEGFLRRVGFLGIGMINSFYALKIAAIEYWPKGKMNSSPLSSMWILQRLSPVMLVLIVTVLAVRLITWPVKMQLWSQMLRAESSCLSVNFRIVASLVKPRRTGAFNYKCVSSPVFEVKSS